ncbi:MAG: phage portal protein [Velocimicrobium sp.]
MFIDSIIETISPKSALNREIKRQQLQMLRKVSNSGYDESGASHSKSSMKGWNPRSLSPQEDIDKNLYTLRQRSRSLMTSSPIATSAIKTSRTNIVGTGLRLRPTVDAEALGLTHEQATEWNKKTQREFKAWAESRYCDATRQNNFYEMQQLVMMSTLINGDTCAVHQYDKKQMKFIPYGLKIKLVEADKVSTPNSPGSYINLNEKAENGNRIYNGVEMDENGAVTAYYICNSYPYSALHVEKKWIRVDAFNKATGLPNVLMVFESERVDQYRGVPFLAPVIETVKQLTRYSEAEIMAAVINGFFTVFVTSEGDKGSTVFNGINQSEEDIDETNEYGLGPGMINVLSPGEHIEMADAKRPSTNFDAFTSSFAKYIGAALEIPQELLLKSFNSSYSASKAAIEEGFRSYLMRRSWLVSDFCQPVYETFMYESIASGRIVAPGFFFDPLIRKAYCKAEWNGPTKLMLDPVKEITAAEKRIDLGVSTHEIETIELKGGDFDSNVQQLKIENEKLKEAKGEDKVV